MFSKLIASLGVAIVLTALPLFAGEAVVVRIGKRTEIVSASKYGIDLGVIDQHRIVDCSFSITNNNWRERRVLFTPAVIGSPSVNIWTSPVILDKSGDDWI